MSLSIPFRRRIYAALLLLYPIDLRRQFGEEMIGVFADQVRDARHRDGWIGELSVWRCIAGETLSTLVSSHVQVAGISLISSLAALGLTCTFFCIVSGN